MKKALVTGLIVAAAMVPIVASASDTSSDTDGRQALAQRERVGCWSYVRSQVGFKNRPSKCVFMRNGGTSSAESVYVTDMKNWKRWGRPTTRVQGIQRANMGFRAPASVRLSKIRTRCGQRVYTQAKFRFPAQDSSSSFRLYSCRR